MMVFLLVGWFVGWFVGWLAGWLAGFWFVCLPAYLPACRFGLGGWELGKLIVGLEPAVFFRQATAINLAPNLISSSPIVTVALMQAVFL